jgi:hypothetical protein
MSHPDPLFDPDNAYDDEWYNECEDDDNTEQNEYEDDMYNDIMDGDFDSAMRDAGFGTDEDYGHYGDDIDAFHDYYGDDF